MSHSYKDLVAWQKAIAFVTEVYRATNKFPGHEMYGLAGQLRRAAVSVPSNIAEGQGRNSPAEFRYFLGLARGSLLELETQLLIARNLRYLDQKETDNLIACCREFFRIVNGLLDSMPRSRQRTTAA